MIIPFYDTFLSVENHLEGQTANKSGTMISAVSFFEKVKMRIEDVASGPPICLFGFVCIVTMPDCRHAAVDKNK
jgi:hypothetical protein